MKYLIIPDIHNRIEWAERLVAAHPGYQPIFLGDYFDSYDDTPSIARKTAEWLRYSVNQKGRIHLMGNHDLPYRWKHMNCPGYHTIKGMAVREYMGHDDWTKVRLYHVITNRMDCRPLLLSHAGFTLANLYGADDFRDVARGGRLEFLRKREPLEHLHEVHKCGEAALRAAYEQREHFWFNQGTRMGARNVGGPFWIDRHAVASPLPGIDQVVGHTIVRQPQRHCTPNQFKPTSEWWFIDGSGRYAALVTGMPNAHKGLRIDPIHAEGELFGQPVTI